MKRIVFLIFLGGFILRVLSVIPANTIIGFDQARDLFTATTIFRDHHLAIIGPTAGNNPNLHHGVIFWHYMVIPLIFARGNPIGVVIWNCFFNALTIVVLYLFAKDLFKSKKIGVIAATVASVSFYFVQYSGWLSNPTGTFLTLPLVFFGLWEYKIGKKWGLPLSFFFLGITIQFELFFIYLIPTGLLAWIILKPKLPSIKLASLSICLFCLTTSSMIATEIKFHFGGIKSILFAGSYVGGSKSSGFFNLLIEFLTKKWETFHLNFWPQNAPVGTLMGIIAVTLLIYEIFKDRKVRQRNMFLLLWFFSPAIMFILGQHNAPWFYIGRPASAILIGSYLISKVKPNFFIVLILGFIICANLLAISDSYGKGQVLLEPDPASLVSDQFRVLDYTYQESKGKPFEINTLTNPLYINAVWGYQYYWKGTSQYGYLPTFAGGNQIYPYNTLPSPHGDEVYLYLIIDTTYRIPPQYRNEIINSALKLSKLIDTKHFGGIEVSKWIINK